VKSANIAVIGLGVMGASLARNLHSRGHRVVGYDRSPQARDRFAKEWGGPRMGVVNDYAELAASLERPRRLLLMVTAGRAVDAVIADASPHLEPDDVIIDGGNSYWADTDRRHIELSKIGLRFVGMGVSGGQRGALVGPSMMPGGDRDAWETLRPILEPAAATSDTGPCVTWCGHGSAGHAVKMVHNGIEYGDMQLIAEVWSLLGVGLGRTGAEMAEIFARWNQGRLESYLIEITADIVGTQDPVTGGILVDQILDVAGQKGTGRWTVRDAVEAGVAVPTVAAAVDARVLSARKSDRQRAAGIFDTPRALLKDITEADLEHALYGAKLMSYTQGFDLLAAQSAERGYETDLAEIARIWKAGCIIRAGFLDRIYAALKSDPQLTLLALAPDFAADLREVLPAWRRVVAAAIIAGHPVTALASALGYFDSLRQSRCSAALIQAQRDCFGAHTYRRIDDPETPRHTEWRSAGVDD
jgi:6-phosphogluconate dehydrogenase